MPERNYLDGEPDHVWRNGKPDYTVVNQAYLTGKTRNWVAGSLGAVVESVVKTLEMEISHKVGPLAGSTEEQPKSDYQRCQVHWACLSWFNHH
jgi:hypothetical protein